MLSRLSTKSASRRPFSALVALAIMPAFSSLLQAQNQQKQHSQPRHVSVVAPTTQKSPKKEGHGPETNLGKIPKDSTYKQIPKGSTDGQTSTGSTNGTTKGSSDGQTTKGSTGGLSSVGTIGGRTSTGSTDGGTTKGSTDGQTSTASTNGTTKGSSDGQTTKGSTGGLSSVGTTGGRTSTGSTDGGTTKGSTDGETTRGSTTGGTTKGSTSPPTSGQYYPPRTLPLPFGFLPYFPNPSDLKSLPPQKLGDNGPQLPDKLDMTGFTVKCVVGPNWPIVLDFMLDSPGDVQVDITGADNSQLKATIHNTPNRRAYAIFRTPADFGTQMQTAAFYVHSVPLAGATTPAPMLRTYGMGGGERAVGSVAIDQLTFQPATIHPQANEVANFGFHAHSAFDGVRAEFVITSLYNGRILVEKDQEQKLSPVPEGVRASGTWEGNGKPGEHMLQVRAWRGLENGGDWVVAWSPDIVNVVVK